MKRAARDGHQSSRTKGHGKGTRGGSLAKTCAIVLTYFKGERFIQEQVDSIAAQTYSDFRLTVFGDGPGQSPDPAVIRNLAKAGKARLHERPRNLGYVRNFLHGLKDVGDGFGYYAFSDQDDIWMPDKLERAVHWLNAHSPEQPALYCSRTEIVDVSGEMHLGFSRRWRRGPSFPNALVQSLAGGNTMVMNRAARDLVVACVPGPDVPVHDWWCYVLISGAGGNVLFDPKPSLRYRQHPANQIGYGDHPMRAPAAQRRRLMRGQFRASLDANIAALDRQRHLLSDVNRERLETFKRARRERLVKRLGGFLRARVHRQSHIETLALYFAACLGRV